MADSLEWISLPTTPGFAGAGDQPRPPMATVVEWPPPPSRGSAPPPPPDGDGPSDEAIDLAWD